jgi:hypothetical protein
MESGLGQKAFFITLGGPQAHDSSGRDDKFVARNALGTQSTKGRERLNKFFISTDRVI